MSDFNQDDWFIFGDFKIRYRRVPRAPFYVFWPMPHKRNKYRYGR